MNLELTDYEYEHLRGFLAMVIEDYHTEDLEAILNKLYEMEEN